MKEMKETIKRSLLKSLTWHSVAFAILVCVVLILDHDIVVALEVGAIDGSIKLISHFMFERGWNRIEWGYIQESNNDDVENPD